MKRKYSLATAERVFDILEALGDGEVGTAGLAGRVGIPKSTLFRYLLALENRGYVRRNLASGQISIGLKILYLSNQVISQTSVHEVALPHMRELHAQFDETVNLGVLDRSEIVYIEILESNKAFKMSSHVGGRDLAHSTSLGKAILAFLPQKKVSEIAATTGLPVRTEHTIGSLWQLEDELGRIRQRGFAIDEGENEEGARCVGAPIFDRRGDVIAAISLSGPAERNTVEAIQGMGIALAEAASQISRQLGHTPD